MTPRDVWKGGSRISLAVCRPWRTWHCALKRAHLGFSGVRVTKFCRTTSSPGSGRGGVGTAGRVNSHESALQTISAVRRDLSQEDVPIDIRRSHMHAERSVQLSSTIAKQCTYLRTWLLEMMKTPQPTVFVFKKKKGYDHSQTTLMMGWRVKCEISRSLVIFTLEDHPHCKQLSA